MDFSVSQVQTGSLKEAGNCLYEAGQTLSGKNLRRSSWLEIAQVIQNGGRLADILLARLQAARTRDDALRVLRIARKAVSRKKRHQTRQAKAAAVPSPAAVLQAYAEDQFWGADDWIDYWEEHDLYPGEATHDEYLEWQAGQRLEFSASELRLPEVLPVSALQSLIVEFAYTRKTGNPEPTSLPGSSHRRGSLPTAINFRPIILLANPGDVWRRGAGLFQPVRLVPGPGPDHGDWNLELLERGAFTPEPALSPGAAGPPGAGRSGPLAAL